MNIKIDSIQLFELLSPKIGNEESKKLVQALEMVPDIAKESAETVLMEKTKVFPSKDDILLIQKEMNSNLKWMIATIVAAVGILIAVIKL